MKKLLLLLMLLSGVHEACAELSKESKVLMTASAVTGLSLAWFYNREPNSVKINRAKNLYHQCCGDIGKHTCYVTKQSAQESLKQIRLTFILQNRAEITASYKELKGRKSWFWNRSDELYEIWGLMQFLTKSLLEYELVEKELVQQTILDEVAQLWNLLSSYNLHILPKNIVNSSSLAQLLAHPIMNVKEKVESLYSVMERYASCKEVYCTTFYAMHEQIKVINSYLNKVLDLIRQINIYEKITIKYQNFFTLKIHSVVDQPKIIHEALAKQNGRYPLSAFVYDIHQDICTLKALSLYACYIRVGSGILDESYIQNDAVMLVISMLEQIMYIIKLDSMYRDELRRQEEQRMHEERMRLEQERMRLERERLYAEQQRILLEQQKLQAERNRFYAKQLQDKKIIMILILIIYKMILMKHT